ncbi:DUF1236 domain-containing protein [Aureimonas leprariae]|uniref:DUF1236 domain-containing protein n=1 Tax=Plantimonas leprariae TaxID=2615207 RepID=A0A7V7PT56_9HYPH|nr:DUF1236 domain-containing protein [Aureimonas leprariae]KAB0682864.1 DUF1236 domain-containing protein [Aureimonas leprariae]
MKAKLLRSLVLLAALALPAARAGAQAPAKAAQPARVNVYQYAVDNPVENATLKIAPSLGASVPVGVQLTPCADEKTYSYFYYNGLPVIVEQSTRSVVRIGH